MNRTRSEISRHYSEEFIEEVLRVIAEEGIYPTEASRRFGISNASNVRN